MYALLASDRAVAMTNTTTAQRVQFVYDGDGRRVKKIDNGVITTVYVGTLFEINVTTGVTTTYYFANGKRIAVRTGAGLYYLHGDHLGSNSVSTDAAGAVTARIGYGAYGVTVAASGLLPADYGYTGQRFDSGDGWLYDYNARIYDQFIGRFISPDSIVPSAGNPQALNRYSYVLGNPLKYTDPSGHCASCVWDFLRGWAYQIVYDFDPIPSGFVGAADAYAIGAIESDAMTVGRLAGTLTTAVIAAVEAEAGIAATGGGAAACGTGVLCLAGAPAMAAGVGAVAHAGVSVAIASEQAGRLGNILMAKGQAGRGVPGELFEKAGIRTSDHFLESLTGRRDRGITEEGALKAYQKGRRYYDPDSGNYIRYDAKTQIAVVVDEDGTAITVYEGGPSPRWESQ